MQNSQGYLHIWGKNYNKPTLLKDKVVFAACGQNHIIYGTSNRDIFGLGSNKFGQLGLRQPQFYTESIPILKDFIIIKVICGAEHTFFINDKHEVYSMGLNIKGQLGQGDFQNINSAKLVSALLPSGIKNNKSLNPNLSKPAKSPIIEVLEKYDLQVKIQQSPEKTFLLQNDQYILDIACGALFTLALTNKSRLFICGLIGVHNLTTLEEQLQKTKFKQINFQAKIQKISAGLSGATFITKEGFAYIWGKFGKNVINVPRKMQKSKQSINQNDSCMIDCKIGDEFAIFLTKKGQILIYGQNIDNQLGCEVSQIYHQSQLITLQNFPYSKNIFAGRNYVFAIELQKNELYGWGSNKYSQIFPIQSMKGLLKITTSKLKINPGQIIIPSSYFSLFISKKQNIVFPNQGQSISSAKNEETISLQEYKKLLADYQLVKAINTTILQKYQPTKKQSREVQTVSKFQINGVTQYRKFNSNTQIMWKEIQIENQINEGGYGVIYRAKWRQILVVVKKFKIQNGQVSIRDFLSQCNAMEAVRHPNIVMFLGAVTTSPNYSLILEYCPKGSLWSFLQGKDNNITWQERRRLAIEIAQGVLYLHLCSPPILHRDLKSLNIFLDANLRIKIGDFGWTKTLQQYMTNKIGTYQWMAPQVIGGKSYSQKADIFSYSIILWQIASRQPPYRNINGAKVSEQVLNRELRPTIPAKCPESWTKLMKKCWESDPNKRPNFKQIIRQLQTMKLA